MPSPPVNPMRGLGSKLFLAFALVALLGVAVVAVVAQRVTVHEFNTYVSQGGQMRAQRLAEQAAELYHLALEQGDLAWADIGAQLAETTTGRGAEGGRGRGRGAGAASSADRTLIVDPAGRVVFDAQGELQGQSLDAKLLEQGAPVVVDGARVATVLLTTPDLSGHTALEAQFTDTVNRAVLWAALLVALASLAAAALLSRHLVAPLRRLTLAAEALARGDLAQRVQVQSRDEIGELGQAFNAMAADLQSAAAQRRRMTADVAHELRNPLSVIRGNLEAMIDGVYPADVDHVQPIYEETMLLQRLVEDLRLLSLADDGQITLNRSDVDVRALLNGVASGAQAMAQEKGIALQVDAGAPGDAPLIVEGDASRLRQVLNNLIGNALRYTPPGGTIALHAAQDAGHVTLSVADTGPGIPDRDLPHIFERFYRGEAARDRASGGSGLGLAIAHALVEAHGGTIQVQSHVGQGTTFTLVLPRA
jgi:signal transduction histidine kinase